MARIAANERGTPNDRFFNVGEIGGFNVAEIGTARKATRPFESRIFRHDCLAKGTAANERGNPYDRFFNVEEIGGFNVAEWFLALSDIRRME